MTVIKGSSASSGIGFGRAVLFEKTREGRLDISFEDALIMAVEELRLLKKRAEEIAEDSAGVFEAYRMLLEDEMFLSPIKEEIKAGASPFDAVISVSEKLSERLSQSKNEYLRQRSEDIRFVGTLLSDVICGVKKFVLPDDGSPVILMAEELTPVDTVSLDASCLAGIVTIRGGTTSHVALLAKSMGIPAVVNAEKITEADMAIIDGTSGVVYIDPDDAIKRELEEKKKSEDFYKKEAEKHKNSPAVTKSGRKITLCINIGTPADVSGSDCSWVDGVGLFRTEFLFSAQRAEPTVKEQTEAYKAVLEKFPTGSVTIRVLDAGGDKVLPYLNLKKEENPFLGLRGIRLCLKNPEIFRNQIKAILMASHKTGVKILLPMVTNLSELKSAKELIRQVDSELKEQGVPRCKNPLVGVMIETPAAAEISDILATEADFFSVGTNDLVQYLTAADRGNSDVSEIYDRFHPAVERVLKRIAVNASKAGITASICGDLASDREFIPRLISMGYTSLSVPYPIAADIKQIIRQCP